VDKGGILFHYNPPYGDIYMEVDEPHRRRGYGGYLVQELKRLCRELGGVPGARCDPTNAASQRTVQHAGFIPYAHILIRRFISRLASRCRRRCSTSVADLRSGPPAGTMVARDAALRSTTANQGPHDLVWTTWRFRPPARIWPPRRRLRRQSSRRIRPVFSRRRRGAAEDAVYSPDPEVWVMRNRVSQTEVSLNLGRFLLQSPLTRGNVTVTLAGYELTRRERPQFPVARYLTEKLGFAPKANRRHVWRGHYSMRGAPQKLVVTFDRLEGHVSARLTNGDRLLVFVRGGRMHSERGSAEHRMVYSAIGRAATWAGARYADRLAICVPRSARFRKTLEDFRKAEGVRRLGIHMLTVDRTTGAVGGLEELEELIGRH
jgi:hypothetical protein